MDPSKLKSSKNIELIPAELLVGGLHTLTDKL
jgi:hypothetical protein